MYFKNKLDFNFLKLEDFLFYCHEFIIFFSLKERKICNYKTQERKNKDKNIEKKD